MPSLDLARTAPCPDPECPGNGQPDQDGVVTFLSCDACGYEWGYVQQRQPVACGAGVSTDAQITEQPGRQPVFLTLGRRPDA